MRFSCRKRMAFIYGRQAAKKRLQFAPALDPKMHQLLKYNECHWDVLTKAWFRGYETKMRSESPRIAAEITVILRELYAPTPVVIWSARAKSAKEKLEEFGI